MLKHYLTVAFRNLWKYKTQNLIGIPALAVGFVVFSMAGYIVKFFQEYDTQYENAERMYIAATKDHSAFQGNLYEKLNEQPGIERITSIQMTMTQYLEMDDGDGRKEVISCYMAEADTSFIDFFSLKLVAGDRQTIRKTPNSLVLFESKAAIFGAPDKIIGKAVTIRDEIYQITGVLKNLPNNTSLHVEALAFNKNDSDYGNLLSPNGRWTTSVRIYALLSKNASVDAVEKGFHDPDFGFERIQSNGGASNLVLFCVFFTGLLILLVTLFNYISFLTAQFYNRLKECSIRKIHGAGKLNQFFLFYIEIAVVFIISSLFGLLLIEALFPVLESSSFGNILQALTLRAIEKQMILYAVWGLVISGLVCILPVQTIDRLSSHIILLGITGKGRKNTVRNLLLAVQLIILLLFFSASTILYLQTGKVKSVFFSTLSGDEKANILHLKFFHYQFIEGKRDILMKNIASSPYVTEITASVFPLIPWSAAPVNIGVDNNIFQEVYSNMVEENYAGFMHAKMLKGSFFTTESSPDAVVVDETFAAFYPDNNPVGYTFERGKIIGVMENIRVNRATENAGEKIPACYTRLQPEQRQHLFIKFQQGKKQAVLKHIDSSFHEFVPENLSMSINTFQEDIDDIFTDENMMMQLSAFFLVVSLIISLLSIYSAITMNTERRRKEVAIRKINGASVGNIILLFSKTYLFVWTIVCTALFPVIYYAGNQWLMTFNRRISLNTVFFGGIYLIVLALIIFTILFRIMKVANENPAEIIKTE